MSNRGKRHLSKPGSLNAENRNMASAGPARKKQKIEANSSEDERSFWTPKHLGDLKAYNRSASEIPAELFRKDLISAMKLADNEPLKSEDFWGIADQWKQEWERGVQVPVNPDSLPEASVHKHKEYPRASSKFTLPDKFIRVTHTEHFDCDLHTLSSTPTQADKMCRYDMDNLDDSWLTIYNGERAKMGAAEVPSEIFEVIIENLEETCWKNIHKVLRQEETDSVEHDEDVICDVCQSPNSEEGNEMVFCDMCNICVHQWCYGITAIPSGSWICRTCALGIKPTCVLCPNKGGAMKCTINCQRWAHVSCALWTPEASIGSVQRMEPITRIANIPQSRWSLVCVLCRERWGACIQCSVKTCKTAYHVTCAFKHGLEMKAITEDENEYPVQLRSYCEKHSRSNKKDASDQDSDGGLKKRKDLSKEQSNQAKAAKLRQIEAEFYKHVDVPKISTVLDIDLETTEAIFYYWKLKRRSLFNKPLLTPRVTDDVCKSKDNPLSKAHSATRQHLERVRNLSYMVIKREKLSKGYMKLREEIFLKQTDIIFNQKDSLNTYERAAIQQANHSSSLYDRMGASSSAPVHSAKQFENIVSIIQGSLPSGSEMSSFDKIPKKIKKESRKDINGIIKKKGSYENPNPYRKSYFNGAYERRSRSRSASQTGSSSCPSTGEDSDASGTSTNRKPPDPGKKMSVFTSSDDDNFSKSGQGAISKFKALLSSAEDSFSETKPVLPTTPRGRGRGGPVKRGRGRPPSTTKARTLKKEKKLFSSDEEKYSNIPESKSFDALMKSTPFHVDVKPTIDKKPIFDSSEDEVVRKPFSPRACKIKPPINHFNASFSSSEDDAPPAKRSPCRGRGRGRSRGKTNQKAPPRNPVQSWLPSTKSSDEDLAPALYKLTSDDDEASDAGLQSSHSDAEVANKRKTRKSDDSTSASECEFDAVHRPRTKGAVKEFAPKLEQQMVKMSRKPSGKSKGKKKGGKANLDSSNDSAKESSQSVDMDVAPSLSLVVPQRAAAKKASELITSQNTVPSHTAAPVVPAETEIKKPTVKHVRDSGSDSDSVQSSPDDLKRVHQKGKKFRKERNSSEAKDEQPPKKNIFQTPEILPYVPLREAARKAAENLKGTVKISSQEDPEAKQKKHTKADKPPTFQKSSKLHRSPRSSSKSSVAVTSDSEEDSRPPVASRPVPAQPVANKGKSIFSESDEETPFVPKSSEPVVDPKALLGKQQLFRGDIFVFDHQSSSEDDVASTEETPVSAPSKGRKKKKNSFRRSAISPDDKLEVENTEPPTVARRKAPDKKLKTSDGRPELGLQPPVTKGAQSPAGREDASHTSPAQEELRQRGFERRPGTLAGHVPKGGEYVASSQSPSTPSTLREPSLRTQSPSPQERKGAQSPQEASSPPHLRTGLQLAKVADLQGPKVPEKGFKSTFQCVTPSQEEAPLDVAANSPKPLLSARLSTSSDPDRSYKDKSADSDDDNISVVDSLVEQPKDSGYKSSMTTPDPSESSSSSHNSTAERINSDEGSLRKSADSRSKYVSPGRRKNLQDVIEERTKMAERSDKRKLEQETVNMPVSSTAPQRSEGEDRDDSQSSSEPTRTNAPSSFVEEWREQWVSSSPPPTSQPPATSAIDHQEGSAPTYPHVALPHPHAMNAQQQLSDYPSFLDMPGHSFHDNLMYYSRLQMMHLHYMSQLSSAQMDDSGERARLQQAAMNIHANQQRLAEDQAHRLTRASQMGDVAHGHSAVPDMGSFPTKPVGGHSEAPPVSEPRVATSRSGFSSESNDRLAQDPSKNDKIHETPVSTPRRETRGSAYAPQVSAQTKALSKTSDSAVSQNHVSYPTAVTSTHTVTTTHTKLSSGPTVSESAAVPVSDIEFLASVDKDGHVCPSSTLTTKSASISSTTVSTASCTPVNKSTTSHLSSSPICAVKSPSIKDGKSSGYSPEIVDVETVDASPPIKRVPIYMQEPKTPRSQTKPSPRNAASSPRWTPKQEKKRAPQKSGRGRGRGRGRGAAKRGRGRRSAIAVPKELVGTVYEFDDFDEFDTAPPTNLRMMREKRQSVETTPQQSFTPTYSDFKETPPPPTTKKTREKKSKSKAPKHEEVPSSPIITPSPLRDPLALDDVRPSKSSGGSSERKKTTPSFPRAEFTSTLTSNNSDDCTNQLKLKIKGPYANSCLSSTLPAVVVPEQLVPLAQVSATPSPSKIRRMRKKELILQYCYQDQVSEQTEDSNTNSNPPHRSGISIPKAVASMPHIPTREDYKKYTLEDSPSRNSTTGRRKKQPRELKQLNWSMKEDKNKRGDRSSPETSRKRARASSKSDEESTKLRITIGKNSPEVVSVSSSCGKPPKKRLPDNMLMKVMSDNLKFREQIMKDFDDGISKAKPVNEEKKARKKRPADDSPNEGNPNKKVAKLSKSKSTDSDTTGRSTPNAATHPLKIRLNLASLNRNDSGDSASGETSAKNSPRDKEYTQPPLKLKLQRRPEGYVTFNNSSSAQYTTPLNHGPGPPSPKRVRPPDPLAHPGQTEVAPNIHSPKEIEHKDRESLTDEAPVSDAVMKKLEAQLAAADGGFPQDLSGIPFSSESTVPCFPIPVPTIKDNPGCR